MPPTTRSRRTGPACAGLLLLGLTVAACGSSSKAAAGTSRQQSCADVAAVLSDGPDPGSDPVGYAAAQPLQLRQLSISDRSLKTAVGSLAGAYQSFASTNGSASAVQAVKAASDQVNAICPGAVS